ncbi:MAG TPA: lipoyl(octanoyl) transferase LipB [Rhodothermales bacterium]|nr:lipoyl(octanoyl) transferase LipB [Rhodothermales bacterium]
MKQPVVVCHLGRIAYVAAWNLQKQIQARLIAAKRREPPETIPHVLLLVEHPPVYTLGKSGDASNLLLSEKELAARGAAFYPIDRGGDITFHGPGQLVGYPILDLDRFFTDIHRYLRELEETVILTCADYGLSAGRVEGRTGVWVEPDASGPERKICAMGIRCSRWVTMHGFALNLNTDLSFFDHIVPCGINDRGVTSLAQETGAPIDEAALHERLLVHFAACFDTDLHPLTGTEAFAYLETLLEVKDLESHLRPPATLEPDVPLYRA